MPLDTNGSHTTGLHHKINSRKQKVAPAHFQFQSTYNKLWYLSWFFSEQTEKTYIIPAYQ